MRRVQAIGYKTLAVAASLWAAIGIVSCDDAGSSGCSTNADCPGGYCISGTCQFVSQPGEDTSSSVPECTSDADCTAQEGGRCDAGDCVYETVDPSACNVDADCDEGTCNLSTHECEVANPCEGGCDDGDPCTQDSCGDEGCLNEPVPGCCQTDEDCDDGDDCTEDTCLGGGCAYAPLGCCTTDEDCEDGTVATVDQCRDGICRYVTPCGYDSDCDDGDVCTTDWCDDGGCANDPVDDCCTDASDCNDGNVNTADRCVEGRCVNEMLPGLCEEDAHCDDGDRCTTDSCDADGNCQHVAVEGCCNTASDCDDGNPCTAEGCTDEGCTHSPVVGCCLTDAACDDGEPCTDDTCSENVCRNVTVSNCCAADADCDDENQCTTDTCVEERCAYIWQEGCCLSAADCDDTNPCTTDSCQDGSCAHASIGGCCVVAADCDDGDPCTTELCQGNSCNWAPVASCCREDADCDDEIAMTTDTCVDNRCTFTPRTDCTVDSDCDDGNPCTSDSCIVASSICRNLLDIGGDCDCASDADCTQGDMVCSLIDAGPDYGLINFCVPREGDDPMGSSCTEADEDLCQSGLCVILDGDPVCYGACVLDADCAGDAFCGSVEVDGPEGERANVVPICIPLPDNCSRETDCVDGSYCDAYTLPDAPTTALYGCFDGEGRTGLMGEDCAEDDECLSDFCINYTDGTGICYGVCATDADCPAGQACYDDMFGMTVNMGTTDTSDDEIVYIPTCLWDVGSQDPCTSESDCGLGEVCFPYFNDDYTDFDPACSMPLDGSYMGPGEMCTAHDDCETGFCIGLDSSYYGECLMFCDTWADCDSWSDCEEMVFTLSADPPDIPEDREISAYVCLESY